MRVAKRIQSGAFDKQAFWIFRQPSQLCQIKHLHTLVPLISHDERIIAIRFDISPPRSCLIFVFQNSQNARSRRRGYIHKGRAFVHANYGIFHFVLLRISPAPDIIYVGGF